jgi:hypothetical protein
MIWQRWKYYWDKLTQTEVDQHYVALFRDDVSVSIGTEIWKFFSIF